MPAAAFAQLQYGVAACATPERERANLAHLNEDVPVAPFDSAAAAAYGPIRMATRDSNKDHLDKLIAAHAVALGATLVTNDEKDFAKDLGPGTENWLNGWESPETYNAVQRCASLKAALPTLHRHDLRQRNSRQART